MQKKRGISLIVLVITLTSSYDEANKIDKIPPENKIETISKKIYDNKVVGCMNLLLLILLII